MSLFPDLRSHSYEDYKGVLCEFTGKTFAAEQTEQVTVDMIMMEMKIMPKGFGRSFPEAVEIVW